MFRKIYASIADKLKVIHQKNKLIFPAVGAVALVVLIMVITFSALGKQVSVKDYMSITVEGYNGYGKLHYEFGDVTFGLRACGNKDSKAYKERKDSEEDFLKFQEGDVPEEYQKKLENAKKLVESVKITYTLPNGKSANTLSNGDVITFTIELDKDLAKELKLTIQDTTFTYLVVGLKQSTEFDVLSCFELQADGYDGYGVVKPVCKQNATKQVAGITFVMEAGADYIRYSLENGLSGTIQPYVQGNSYNKSNGDKVELKADVYTDGFLNYGVKLMGLERKFTVDGLKENLPVDLLQYYQVTFIGATGSGSGVVTPTQETATFGDYEVNLQTGEWTKDGEYIAYTSVQVSNAGKLSNGETAEISVTFSEKTFADLGIKFINSKQEVTVEKLDTYVVSLAEIKDYANADPKIQQVIQQWLKDNWALAVHNKLSGTYKNKKVGDDLALYKMLLTTPNDPSADRKNSLWLFYSVTVSDNKIKTPTTCYIVLCYDDVTVNADGSLGVGDSHYKYGGSTDYEALYNALYTSLSQNYDFTIEVSE